jgi:hypothetical protein
VPVVRDLSGWSGQLALLDPDTSRVLAITFFREKEDIEAASDIFEEMPKKLPEDLRQMIAGTRRSVDVYDVRVQEGVTLGDQAAVAH